MGNQQGIGKGIGNLKDIAPKLVAQIIDPDLVVTICQVKTDFATGVGCVRHPQVGAALAEDITFDACNWIGCAFKDRENKGASASGYTDGVHLVDR